MEFIATESVSVVYLNARGLSIYISDIRLRPLLPPGGDWQPLADVKAFLCRHPWHCG